MAEFGPFDKIKISILE